MPSPLASIYSAADSFKRGLLDAVQNPVDKMRQVIGNANDRAGVLNALTGQTADQTVASIKSGGPVMPDTPESRQLTQMMADAYNPAGMMVYHGSPYKFNAFAPKAIGSGEGHQAYGYGHYVAESPDVAKSYRDILSSDRGFSFDGKSGLTRQEVQDMVNSKYGSGYLDGVIRPSGVADSFIDDMVTGVRRAEESYPRQYKSGSQRAKVYDELRGQITHSDPGSLYKIDLPDDQISKMLSWDDELGKQNPEIQKLAKQYGLGMDDLGGDLVAAMNAKLPEGAESMRSAGVPGIKYFDAQSRGGKQADTRNFVVFPGNEGLLKILERNGIPLE
jgi:hypothetical protein